MPALINEEPPRSRGGASSAHTGILLPLSSLALFVTALKGIAFPHHWAATHLLFHYGQHGFVKRALLGTITKALGPWTASYTFFLFWSSAILVMIAMLLFVHFVELTKSQHSIARLAPLLFASSLAVAYLANSLGYFDHLGLLATLVLLRLRSFWTRYAFTAMAFTVLILIHEATYLQFLPLAALALWLEHQSVRAHPGHRGVRLAAMTLLLVGLSLLAYVVGNATITQAQSIEMYHAAVERADYLVNRAAFDVLHRAGADNLGFMMRAWTTTSAWTDLAYGAAVTLPTAALLLHVVVSELRRRGASKATMTLSIIAGISPLSLHALGWDMHRWNTLAITACFLVLCMVMRAPGSSPRSAPLPVNSNALDRPSSQFMLGTVGCLLLLNASSSLDFLNGRGVQSFPFRGHVSYWEDVARGRRNFPSIPKPKEKRKPLQRKPGVRKRRLNLPSLTILPRPKTTKTPQPAQESVVPMDAITGIRQR